MKLLLFLFFYAVPKIINSISVIPLTTLQDIAPGKGFISAKSSLSLYKCFKVSSASEGGAWSGCNLLYFPVFYSKVLSNLKLEITQQFTHFKLHDNILMRFLNKIIETEFTVTLSYFSMRSSYQKYDYNAASDILTEEGKEIYQNGNNKNFLNECGDYLIKTYNEGLVLIYSIKIFFRTKNEKKIFLKTYNNNPYGHFKDFFKSLTKTMLSLGIYDAIFELNGIQIGGLYNNEVINKAKENDFVIAKCTIDTINECEQYVDNLIDYFLKDFMNQKDSKIKLIPLEKIEAIQLVQVFPLPIKEFPHDEEQDTINSMRSALINRLDIVYELLNHFKHIESFYKIKLEEIPEFIQELQNYYDLLLKNNLIANCYADLEKIAQCSKTLLSQTINYDKLISKLKLFFSNFNFEKVLAVDMKGRFCLPNNMSWSDKKYLYIRQFRDDRYILTDFGLKCDKDGTYSFTCTDGIIEFTIKISHVSHDPEKTIVCTNNHFGGTITNFQYVPIKEQRNEYYVPIFRFQ